jgi:hypothetical protein
MAATTKNLNGVGDSVVLDVPQDWSTGGSLQYPSGGTGTIVVEGIVEGQDESLAANWIQLKLNNPNTKLDVDNLTAVGIGNFETWAYSKVRARKTATVGACSVSIAIGR